MRDCDLHSYIIYEGCIDSNRSLPVKLLFFDGTNYNTSALLFDWDLLSYVFLMCVCLCVCVCVCARALMLANRGILISRITAG